MTEPMATPETFDFGDYTHRVGDPECIAGWCGTSGPSACEKPGCAGLVHSNFGDESWDSYWLDTKCDVCGEPE